MGYCSFVISVRIDEIARSLKLMPQEEDYNTQCKHCGTDVEGDALCDECYKRLGETLEESGSSYDRDHEKALSTAELIAKGYIEN